MPGLGDEVDVRLEFACQDLGGGSGSRGGLWERAAAAMVHGLRFRIAGWKGHRCGWLLFLFLGFQTGERRRLAAGSLWARGLRKAGSWLPVESPAAPTALSTIWGCEAGSDGGDGRASQGIFCEGANCIAHVARVGVFDWEINLCYSSV